MTRRDFVLATLVGFAGTAFWLLHQEARATGVILWVVAYLGLVRFAGYRGMEVLPRTLLGPFAPVAIILNAAVASVLVERGASRVLVAAAVLAVILAGLDGLIRRASSYDGTRIASLPGVHLISFSDGLSRLYFGVTLAVPAALFLVGEISLNNPGATDLWPWIGTLVIALQFSLSIMLLLSARRRRNASRLAYERLPEVLREYGPRFVFYWDGPAGMAFQLGMWVPYLQRIGVPFFILVRNQATFDRAVEQSHGVPVILARTMKDTDRLVLDSLSVAFYSNNAARNTHFVRYPNLMHIQLLHGDSDKVSSFNPITAMFDRLYVAGQAGIDRYVDHGIDIPRSKFRIVGRPQVEDIAASLKSIGAVKRPTVLYAPTWRGYHSDASYASVPVAPQIIEQLLERGCRVIFRPHPHCYRDDEYRSIIGKLHEHLRRHSAEAGVDHVFGDAAESTMSLVDCFNLCDAMISDVSSVVVDFLFSEKPFAMVSMGTDVEVFRAEFPLAEVAYVMSEDGSDWQSALDSLLRDDPLATERAAMRVHYLGDFARERYADGFISEARNEVLRDPAMPKAMTS